MKCRSGLSPRRWFIGVVLALAPPSAAQIGTVQSEQKISETMGGFGGLLDPDDLFGFSVAALGDLDGDGVGDLAVGARNDDDGGTDKGAVWILFLAADGTVQSHQKISATEGGFGGALDPGDFLGASVAFLGDLDGDGVGELAAGAPNDDDGGTSRGAVWILFLDTDGTVKSEQKISDTAGSFTGALSDFDVFGHSQGALGDLDGDGIRDLVVGAYQDDDGEANQGALWVLFLDTDGTVQSHQKISETTGGFGGSLQAGDFLGWSVCSLGDLDGDGTVDLAVGATGDDSGGMNQGAVWILFLEPNGTVESERKISEGGNGFVGPLDPFDDWGSCVAAPGDLDHDGIADLVAGGWFDGDGGFHRGAAWILFLDADGTVKGQRKISDTEGNFGGVLDDDDRLGWSAAPLGDLDGDGILDLAVGAAGDDDGGANQGALWILFLGESDVTPPLLACPALVTARAPKGPPQGVVITFSVSATDETDPSPVIVCVPPSGSFFPWGTTIVTCTATDDAGNQAVCTFPVVVSPGLRKL